MASGRNDGLLIEIDGGVSNQNALKLIQAGADVLVAGNAVFSATDPISEISGLKNLNPELIGS
jgi:ribulose-phosphate 3-epimerase